jgi:indolepyruvate ferredoxin oxidoreductase
VEALIAPERADAGSRRLSESFEEMVERRADFLTAYQNRRYANRYRAAVAKVRAAEAAKAPGRSGLAEAVARYLFKLMAYKDEYEVARLYSDGAFARQVEAEFDGDNLRFEFHLAPPILARTDPRTGAPRKMSLGPWAMRAFAVLAKFKALRGTPFDPFGYAAERRMERRLVRDYLAMVDEVLVRLTPGNYATAVGLASIPEKIRGFGHVKARHLAAAKAEEAALMDEFRKSEPERRMAAE